MDENAIGRALKRIAHEIVEKNKGCAQICLVGVQRRGVPLAERIADELTTIEGVRPPVGVLDITFYRDDLSTISVDPVIQTPQLPFSVTDKRIVLVDDVLYTGRTVRAAMDALISLGRPAEIQLAVLIDRGHRELPIRGDYVGKNVPTAKSETVAVRIPPLDDCTAVELYD
ncbi:MAG: bifunctional pyr operon transcriptional regulator/uracil phosphoribosyltransferase PyrR [Clostridia bacterium]|nr:bifunctional pyr operon transcriptional regulator/uracil phosphoribosyltransferase PyrR [Clostridia bacterium]